MLRVKLQIREKRRHAHAQVDQHRFEQGERLALVLVQRVALPVRPEADALAQMIERQQVLLPVLVQHLQEKVLLDHAPQVAAVIGRLLGHLAIDLPLEPFPDLDRADAFLRRPGGDGRIEIEQAPDFGVQRLRIPLLRVGLLGYVADAKHVDDLAAHVGDVLRHVLRLHQIDALFVDDLALVVHHVVEPQQILPNIEVARLDLLLSALQRLVDPRMDDRLAFLEPQFAQHRIHALRPEDSHQVVFETEEEPGGAGIALPSRPAPQLVVDTAAFMALRTDDEQAAGVDDGLPVVLRFENDLRDVPFPLGLVAGGAGFLGDPHFQVAAELDVRAPSRHVGGDRDGTVPAGLGDDMRLLLVVPGVQDVVLDPALLEEFRQVLRPLDGDRAHENRLSRFPTFPDLRQDRVVLLVRRAVDLVVLVVADTGQVRGDGDDVEPVDVGELLGLRQGRARHARELVVKPEIVLKRDRGEGLVLLLDGDALLGFQRLMQTFGIPAPLHHPAGELVDDDDLVVLDDVIRVPSEQLVRAQRLVDVMDGRDVGDVVERTMLELARPGQELLDPLDTRVGEGDGPGLLVDLEIPLFEGGDHLVDGEVQVGRILGGSGDDQRRARLVDEDAVDLVDDGEVVLALDHLVQHELHVVAQVIEAEFVVGAVGHVRGIRLAPPGVVDAVHDDAHLEAEGLIDAPHPLGVAPREIIVDRDDVNALAADRVQIDRQRGHQRLALAGGHFGDLALMEDHAAQQLDVVMTLSEVSLGGLADGGEGVDQDIVEGLAVLEPLAERGGACAQLVVREALEIGLEGIDGVHLGL